VSFVIALVVFVLMASGTIAKIQKSTRSRLTGSILDPEYKTDVQQMAETQAKLQKQLAKTQAKLAAAPQSVEDFQAAEAQRAAVAQTNLQNLQKAEEARRTAAIAAEEARRAAAIAAGNVPAPAPAPVQTWGQWARGFVPGQS
jgi:peptidoglycan hydrolase CwlO-like protein